MAERAEPDRERTSGRAFVKAISHPVRTKIVVILEHEPATVAELAAEIGVPARTVRHHVAILRKGGFVTAARSASRRNVLEYSFRGTTFGQVDEETYEELSPAERRTVTNSYLRAIARGVTRFVAAGSTYDEHFPVTLRARLAVDEEGWRALEEIAATAMEQVVELKGECARRLAARGESGIEAEFAIVGLETPTPVEPEEPEG
jgi:DNA-binding transcriptional ArsR family regulator